MSVIDIHQLIYWNKDVGSSWDQFVKWLVLSLKKVTSFLKHTSSFLAIKAGSECFTKQYNIITIMCWRTKLSVLELLASISHQKAVEKRHVARGRKNASGVQLILCSCKTLKWKLENVVNHRSLFSLCHSCPFLFANAFSFIVPSFLLFSGNHDVLWLFCCEITCMGARL